MMESSKDLPPISAPFLPNIFFRNQFCSPPVWPSKDINLSGQVAIVTGANQGLGLEASDQLLSLKLSHLVMAVRSVSKGEAAANTLRAKYPKAKIDILPLDMSSYDSIRTFVSQLEQLKRIDMVILNAGVRKTKPDVVPGTGHEETIQINYISTVLLCILLLPVIKRKSSRIAGSGSGRISIVSSGLALQAKFPTQTAPLGHLLSSFDDPANFDVQDTYNTSKLLGMMFLYKLTEYVSVDDGVVVNLVDPGFVAGTSLSRDLSLLSSAGMAVFKRVAARSLAVGASTYVDAAVVKGKESHGCYLMSWKISPFARLLYTPKGKQVIETLWQETMEEPSFAGVQSILDDLKKA